MTEIILTGPKLDFTPTTTLGEFFFESCQKFKNRICQIDVNTNQQETYSTLNQRCVRVALAMSELGITSKDVIATCSVVNLDTPVPVLASFYLGAKVANLDPTLSVRQTSHLLSLVSPRMIFVEEASVDLIEKSLLEANLESEIVVIGTSLKYKQLSDFCQPKLNEDLFKPTHVDLSETGIIFFSSGTTGLPKAVCHSHRSFLNVAYSFYKSTGNNFDVVLNFTSFFWISGVLFLTCANIAGGSRIVGASIVKVQQVFQSIEKYKVTFMIVAPVLTYYLTDFPEYEKYDTSSLCTFFTGGTFISPVQIHKVKAVLKSADFRIGYGLTEVGISTFNLQNDRTFLSEKMNSCGKPTFGFSIKIIDVENNTILGPNQKGEIYIKSEGTMNGYFNADSSSVFDQDGFVKTGDLGFYDDDGYFYIVGRLKEMFKYMSWHIVPASIEKVLLENPAVKEAVVFGLPKNEEEGEVPTACVVLKEDFSVTKQDIEDFVAERVSNREKLRGGVHFVKELFRTTTGKVMRKEIREYVIQISDKT